MTMNIIVISERNDSNCYELASQLYKKYGEAIFTNIFSAMDKE